jgi:uncharacterized NAD-dependent epimerase/dehydratase family protein
MTIPYPSLIFLGDGNDLEAKTGSGICHWRPENCLGQHRLSGGTADLGLRPMDPAEAVRAGAKSMIIGVANGGGFIPDTWMPTLVAALEAGLDIAAGLHERLGNHPQLAGLAKKLGRRLIDVRHPLQESFLIGTGVKRSGKRLLTVGSDCSVGKMYTALAIDRSLRRRGIDAQFRATGQTGIFISGSGVAVDAVVADFIAGAAEQLSPDAEPDHWDVIEGQGSLFHPAYAGVSMGLLHGSQADALVLCHAAGRTHMDDAPHYQVPPLADVVELNLKVARRTNPAVRLVGVALNSSALSAEEARGQMDAIAQEFEVPCCDPLRTGVETVVDRLLE